jgi:integrase
MAWIQTRQHASRTVFAVRFRIDGRQSTVTWPTMAEAEKFRALVDGVGPKRALDASGISDTVKASPSGQTVGEYLDAHIATLTGVERKTITEYTRYAQTDLKPLRGIPLAALTRADVAGWVNGLKGSGKTVQNKHAFLSGALKRAVLDGKIPAHPSDGLKMPRTEKREMTFLTKAEFALLLDCFTEHYKPLVRFLVASGCRFSEAAALTPADVDWSAGAVTISRSWKKEPGGWGMGAPKTDKGRRTIHVPPSVLEGLDHDGEWLFTNAAGNPVRIYGFRENVWYPTVKKAQAKGLKKKPRVHDLRHTCASWMVQSGVPLAEVQRTLGHESIETTVGTYGHLDPAQSKAAAAVIAGFLD